MSVGSEVVERLQTLLSAIEEATTVKGTHGKVDEDSGATVYPVPGKPGFTYVTLQNGSVAEALNVGSNSVGRIGLPLRLKSGPYGLEVTGIQKRKAIEGLDDNAVSRINVGPHSHEPGFGNEDMVSNRRIVDGLAWYRGILDGSFSVRVNKFWYKWDGVDYQYPGGNIDITSHMPAAGLQRWVKVSFDPTTASLVAADGSDISYFATLNDSDLLSIASNNLMPLAGVQMSAAFSDLSAATIRDARVWNSGNGIILNDTAFNNAVYTADKAIILPGTGISVTANDMAHTLTIAFAGGAIPFLAPAKALAATNINVASPGITTLDGYTLVANDRILLTAQTTASENGLWIWSASGLALTRPADFPHGGTTQAFYGVTVDIGNGTVYGGQRWRITTTSAITIDTSSQTWAVIQSGITQLTGDGTAGPGSGSQVFTLAASGVTAGTYTKVTVDAKGRVTSGATTDLSGSDVTGTLAAGRFPALTGVVTTSAGSLTTAFASSTGSGAVVLATSPTISSPTLTSPVFNTGVSGTAVSTDGTFASPSNTILSSQKAIKTYVDAVAAGLSPKESVAAATTAALPTNTYSNGASGVGATLTGVATGVLTVDGYAVALNDRVLVKNEVTAANNGIYLCTVAGAVGVAYVLTRTTDSNTSAEIVGASVFVNHTSTTLGGTGWVNTNSPTVVFGTTAITFTQFTGGAALVAGAGISIVGNTISIDSTVVTLTGSQTLTNKTLTAPTIGDFTNANHNHQNAAGGGQLNAGSVFSAGTVPLSRGGTNVDLSASGGATAFLAQDPSHVISARSIVIADIATALTTPGPIGSVTPGTGAFTTLNASGILTTQSGAVRFVRVVTAAGAVTVATSDDIVVINKSSGAATTVNLPSSPTTGQTFVIMDGKGDAATNNITIAPASGNINGASTLVLNTNYASAEVTYNGTQWNAQVSENVNGTVTSIATGTGLTGGPITNSGTISLVTPVALANGGTHADLSATGPGALWQTTNGGNVQDIEPVIIRVKNVSGSTANANEIGLLDYDATNGYSYNTTTTANQKGQWCVVVVGAANNSDIWVAIRGRVTVKLNANSSIGNYVLTSTTAGQASVSTTMRPEIFGVCLTANSGGAGGTCSVMLLCNRVTRAFTVTNDTLRIDSLSSTDFVATINGAPSGSNVVYNAPSSGSDNTIVYSASSTTVGRLVLHNTTRGTEALISSVNTGTKTITLTATVPAGWVSGDTITVRSQTASGAIETGIFLYDLDLANLSLPNLVTAGEFLLEVADTAISGALYDMIHPYQAVTTAFSVGFALTAMNASGVFLGVGVPLMDIINSRICFAVHANGAGTGHIIIRIRSIQIAVP